jgi:DNA-binding beta-propeller fold protein YncE
VTTILADGAHRYEVVSDWARLPPGWLFGEVPAVAVDSSDRVYAFTRGKHPMIVFDRDGNFLRSWGEGIFHRPHGLSIGPDDTIYCTDEGDHTVRKFTTGGRMLLEIGLPGQAAPFMSGQPFNRCTHTALSPAGDIYVSDGYGNARVHKFSSSGALIMSWGGPGTGPGQFNIPHNICCDPDGWVYVADRENNRIQIFDSGGRFTGEWRNLHRPCALCLRDRGPREFIVGELGPGTQFSNRDWPRLGPRVSLFDQRGGLTARFGDRLGASAPSAFISPHGIAVDSLGAIYVGEVSRTNLKNRGIACPPDEDPPCLRKLIPVSH